MAGDVVELNLSRLILHRDGLTMARIEDLADRYGRHIATPWQRTVAGAQRVVMVVYDKELERALGARKLAFEMATREAGRPGGLDRRLRAIDANHNHGGERRHLDRDPHQANVVGDQSEIPLAKSST